MYILTNVDIYIEYTHEGKEKKLKLLLIVSGLLHYILHQVKVRTTYERNAK